MPAAFASCRCLSLSPCHVSAPRSPNPSCGFPATGSPVGSCRSLTGRSDTHGDGAAADGARSSGSRSFPRSLPFAFACGGSVALEHSSGVLGSATPGALRSFLHLSSPEAPSLLRRYPLSAVVRASPPPCPARPVPCGIPVWRVHATDRASRVAAVSLLRTCHRPYPGGTDRCSHRSLHVVACTLAEPPEAALFHRSASVRVVTSFYVREVAESRNPDRIREPLFPCRRRRKPPQRPATDASPPSAGRAPGAWPGPRRRRVGPFSSSAFRAVFELGRPVAAIPARPQRKRGYRPASQKDRNAGMSTGP